MFKSSRTTRIASAICALATLAGQQVAADVFVQNESRLPPPSPISSGETGYSVALAGTQVVIGARIANQVLIWGESSPGVWTLVQSLTPPTGTLGFGIAVDVDGNRLVVGANLGDERAFVYDRSGAAWNSSWSLVSLSPLQGSGGSEDFGWSVAVDGSTVLVGAKGFNTGTGRVYVFEGSGGTWSLTATLDGFATNNLWGWSVDLVGDTALVGAPRAGTGSRGEVGIWTRSLGVWSSSPVVIPSPSTGGTPQFGDSVAIHPLDQGMLLVGESDDHGLGTGPGAVHVYTGGGATWNLTASVSPNGSTNVHDGFGAAISFDGELLLVGAPLLSGSRGSTYLYRHCADNWFLQGRIEPTSFWSGADRYGDAVSVGNGRALIGSPFDESLPAPAPQNHGSAYVFDFEPNFSTYCTAGTSTNGCVPTIVATGDPSVSQASGFTLSVSSLEGQKQGLIFYGVSGIVANVWAPGSTSFLCVKLPTQRMSTNNSGGTSGGCDGAISEDWLAFVAANSGALGTPLSAGECIWAQCWYRDPPAPDTTNLSNGLMFHLVP